MVSDGLATFRDLSDHDLWIAFVFRLVFFASAI